MTEITECLDCWQNQQLPTMDQITYLNNLDVDVEKLRTENQRLRDQLPMTADVVDATGLQYFWHLNYGDIQKHEVVALIYCDHTWWFAQDSATAWDFHDGCVELEYCYSTRQAAEAAKEKKDE